MRTLISIAIFLTMLIIPTPAQAASGRCPKWEPILKQHGLPVKEFSMIMWRESRCEPKAIGWNYKSGMSHRDCKLSPAAKYKKCHAVRSYDSGLLQINSGWKTVTKKICKSSDMSILLKPECNIKVAKYLYDNGGLGHWRATSSSTVTTTTVPQVIKVPRGAVIAS